MRSRYPIRELHMLYDNRCRFCVRVAVWLKSQPTWFPLHFHPMRAPETALRFPAAARLVGAGKFVVVDDRGGVYVDTNARIMLIYALKRFRGMSYRIARWPLSCFANGVFNTISRNRHHISSRLNDAATRRAERSLCGTVSCES